MENSIFKRIRWCNVSKNYWQKARHEFYAPAWFGRRDLTWVKHLLNMSGSNLPKLGRGCVICIQIYPWLCSRPSMAVGGVHEDEGCNLFGSKLTPDNRLRQKLARYVPCAIWSRLVSWTEVQATHARVGIGSLAQCPVSSSVAIINSQIHSNQGST